MKVWQFYRTYKGRLEPTMYAFTNKKNRAMEFQETRKGLGIVVKEMSRDDFIVMNDRLQGMRIIPDQLSTRVNPGECELHKVTIYATMDEIMYFKSHMYQIVTMLLGMHTLDINLFAPELKRTLQQFGMDSCRRASEEVDLVEFYMGIGDEICTAQLFDGNYKLDELMVFMLYHKDTFGI